MFKPTSEIIFVPIRLGPHLSERGLSLALRLTIALYFSLFLSLLPSSKSLVVNILSLAAVACITSQDTIQSVQAEF